MESVLKKSIALAILLTLNISFASNHHQHNKAVFVESRDILATIELKNFRQGMGKFNEMGLDIAGVDVKKNIADVVVNDSELNKLKELGFNVKVKMTKSIMRGPDQDYKNPAEIEAFMKDYAQRFPEISKLQVIGQSVEGRNIFALKIMWLV